MFVFALWDGRRRRLLVARDRLGKRPLYHRLVADGIAFASEPKAFLAEPGFRSEVDLPAISAYLSLQCVPVRRGAFRGVRKLPPAHTLVIEDGRVTTEHSYARKGAVSQAEAFQGLTEHSAARFGRA